MTMIAPREPTLTEKLCFLSQPQAYAHAPVSVSMIETHMSFIFLADSRVYKLKKPVRYPFLDFSTLPARAFYCREEVRLNRRLARDVYLGVVPVAFSPDKGFSLSSPLSGETIVDWLVEMQRLPSEDMLDTRIHKGRVANTIIDDLCTLLTDFYRSAEPANLSPEDYYHRFIHEQVINRNILDGRRFDLDVDQTTLALDGLDALLHDYRDDFLQRVDCGAVVDGHGDLRPEHICLTSPIVIFDCLEFNPMLRQVDPYDELAYLDVECAALGAPGIGDRIISTFMAQAIDPPPPGLIASYAVSRAVLRARLSVAHLLEPTPRQPARWEPLARNYLTIATHYLRGRI